MLLHIYTLIGHHSVSWAFSDDKGPRCRLDIDHESVGSISNRRRPDCLCYLGYDVSNQRLNCCLTPCLRKHQSSVLPLIQGIYQWGGFLSQKASNTENICLSWWRHHWTTRLIWYVRPLDTITLRFESLLTWWYTCSLQWRHVTVAVSQSPATGLSFTQFIQADIKGSIKGPHHWPLWGEYTSDRWIPLTKDQ